MSFKWFGAVLVFLGCTALGFLPAGEHRRQHTLLLELQKSLERMEQHLAYQGQSLPALCYTVGSEIPGIIGKLWCTLSDELSRQIRPEVGTCMGYALAALPTLPPSTAKLLQEIGTQLGQFDLHGQLKALDNAIDLCKKELERLERDMESRIRTSRSLGLCAGAALVLLLL